MTCILCQNAEPGHSQPAVDEFLCSKCVVSLGTVDMTSLIDGLVSNDRQIVADFLKRLA
ncbi:MAG: hypothetical protein SWO11_21305 [Thermodesulfobacteriota bacterium]|jgi:hypothetical protein|nr:hypothetical protein [Thermodesulfobacteriota bacterium]